MLSPMPSPLWLRRRQPPFRRSWPSRFRALEGGGVAGGASSPLSALWFAALAPDRLWHVGMFCQRPDHSSRPAAGALPSSERPADGSPPSLARGGTEESRNPGKVAPLRSPPEAATPLPTASTVGPSKTDRPGPWMVPPMRTWRNLETHRCQTPLRQDPSVRSRASLNEEAGLIRIALGGNGLTPAHCETRQPRVRMTLNGRRKQETYTPLYSAFGVCATFHAAVRVDADVCEWLLPETQCNTQHHCCGAYSTIYINICVPGNCKIKCFFHADSTTAKASIQIQRSLKSSL